MTYHRKLGVFATIPVQGEGEHPLFPTLSEKDTSELSMAFLRDLFSRISKLKKIEGTVFCRGKDPSAIKSILPRGYTTAEQSGKTRGERFLKAFRTLLSKEGSSAVVLDSKSPDVPLKFIKRAYLKLKHKDVVLGPCTNGGCYLIGLKSPLEALFEGTVGGDKKVFKEIIERIGTMDLTLSLLPVWYSVGDFESLLLIHSMVLAKKIERSERLLCTEKVLERIFGEKEM